MHLEAAIEDILGEKKPAPDAYFKREESSIVKAAFKSLSLLITAASFKKSLQFGFQGEQTQSGEQSWGLLGYSTSGGWEAKRKGEIYELSKCCWLFIPRSMWDLSEHHKAKWCIISQSSIGPNYCGFKPSQLCLNNGFAMEICLIDWMLRSGRVGKMNLCQAELQVSIYYLSIALYLSLCHSSFPCRLLYF